MNGDTVLKDVYDKLESMGNDIHSIRENIAERVGESKTANAKICTEVEGLKQGQEVIHNRITSLKENLQRSIWASVTIILGAIIAIVAAYIQKGG